MVKTKKIKTVNFIARGVLYKSGNTIKIRYIYKPKVPCGRYRSSNEAIQKINGSNEHSGHNAL